MNYPNRSKLMFMALVTGLVLVPSGAAWAQGASDESTTASAGFALPATLSTDAVAESLGLRLPPAPGLQAAPPRDPVGGFVLGILAGVQLRGSASGQFGLTLAWFKQSTSNVGFEFEGAFTRGPDGEVYHGLLSVILQSGSRSARMVPYLAAGGGVYHAQERLRDSLIEALPEFGIPPVEQSETGAMIAFGLGVRYYMSEKLSFRADYREMRGVTTGDGDLFDRLHSLRRIAGIMMLRF